MSDDIKIVDIIDMRLGNNRTGLQDFINFIKRFYNTKELTLLEIGSFKGESSEMFAKEFKSITCVDSWIGKSVEMFLKTCTPEDIENEFNKVKNKYSNITKIKGDSIEISKKLTDIFDVVYIDAAHDYGSVKNDIAVWKDKAKIIISGHDYSPKHKGVIKAVNEAYYLPDEKFKDNSWLVWKDRSSKSLQYKYDKNYTLNRIEGHKEFKAGYVHPRKIAIANYFDVKNKVVFDVGYGRGELLKLCYDRDAECYGLDYSRDAYDIAKKYINNDDINLFYSDLEVFTPQEIPEIDILFMIDIVEHIKESEFDLFMEKIKYNFSKDVKCFVHTPKDIHPGDMYNMHITQWTKEMLIKKLKPYFKKIEIKENPGNWYAVCEGKNA